ncbi:unnamed protein product [Lepidochelys olivacea]
MENLMSPPVPLLLPHGNPSESLPPQSLAPWKPWYLLSAQGHFPAPSPVSSTRGCGSGVWLCAPGSGLLTLWGPVQVSGWMPRAGLLLLSLLLCFGTETARSIDSATFKAIMDHVHQYRPVTIPHHRSVCGGHLLAAVRVQRHQPK